MEKHTKTKTAKARSDTAVQGTNDSSIVSKCSAAAQGYVTDHFVKHMAAKVCRRSPLINRGYCIRMLAMNHVFKIFLDNTQHENQVLVLGAGFDAAFFNLNSDGLLRNTVYFEVDFPSVLRRKLALIKDTEALNSQLGPAKHPTQAEIVFDSDNYKLLGVDLTDLLLLTRTLQAVGFHSDKPTLVVSEVVLTYIQPERSSAVIEWAAEHMSNAVFVTYEQINPDDGFGTFMLKHFGEIGSSLKSINKFPSLQSQVHRYKKLGWEYVEAMDMNYFSHHILTEGDRNAIWTREPFDEFEEWNLTCGHYMLLTALQGSCRRLSQLLWPRDESNPSNFGDFIHSEVDTTPEEYDTLECAYVSFDTISQPVSPSDATVQIKRFGHSLTRISATDASCMASSEDRPVTRDHLLCMGGFGEDNSRHCRLKSVVVIDPVAMETVPLDSGTINSHSNIYGRMYHTVTQLRDGASVLVFGGRRSPLQACTTSYLLQCSSVDGRLSVQPRELTSDMAPTPRWRHSATAIVSEGHEYVVVYGGRTGKDTALNDCYCLDTEHYTWHQVPQKGTRPPALHSHSADVWSGRVYIAGGLDSAQLPQGEVYSLSISDWSWSKLHLSGKLRPRYSHCSGVYNNYLVVVGGVSDRHPPPGVAVINLETQCVQEYNWPLDSWPVARMMHNIRGAVIAGRLVIVGGGGNCFSFGTHFNSDVTTIDLGQLCHDTNTGTGSS